MVGKSVHQFSCLGPRPERVGGGGREREREGERGGGREREKKREGEGGRRSGRVCACLPKVECASEREGEYMSESVCGG